MSTRIMVFALLLATFSSTAHSVTLGPELEITARITDAGDGSTSHRAVAGWDGKFYVVWVAPRALMLSVFDGDGKTVEERTLIEDVAPDEALILNDGSRLVVLWNDANAVRISTLSGDGTLVTPGGVIVGGYGYSLDIAASAENYLVIWRIGSTLRGAILDRNLETVAGVYDGDFPANAIRVASNGGGFLLSWTGVYLSPGLFARAVRLDGTFGAPSTVDPDAQTSAPSIDWNGSQYIIASAVESGLRMTLVDADGKPSGAPFLSWAHAYVSHATLSRQLFGFVVVAEHWVPVGGIPEMTQPSRLYSFIVSRSGTPYSEPTPVSTVDTVNTLPALASNGTDYFATWNYSASGDDQAARGTVIHSSGEVLYADEILPGVTVSRAIRSQSDARVAWGNRLFLAVWVDSVRERNEKSLRFARLDREGRSLDGTGIELHRSDRNVLPSLACGSVRCLVAYQVPTDTSQIYSLIGRWISRDGRSISAPFTIAPSYTFDYSGTLASDGEYFATVAQQTLHVIRPDQSVVTTPVPGVADSLFRRYLIASNGDGFGVFWSDDAVRFVRFDHDGQVTNTTSILPTAQNAMAVAASGSEFLLVTDGLLAIRVSSGGVPIGGLFDITANQGREPAVVWSGTDWIVTWSRRDQYGQPTEMYASTVLPSGVVRDRFLVAAQGGRASAAGSRVGASMLLFPVTFDTGAFGKAIRIHARALDPQLAIEPRRHGVRRP